MKIKKHLGNFLLLLSVVLVNAGTASVVAVGTEEVTGSIKKVKVGGLKNVYWIF